MEEIREIIIVSKRRISLPPTTIPVRWDPKPDCRQHTLIIHGPRTQPPDGPCYKAMIPHLQLLPYIVVVAERHGWTSIAGDPEYWAYKASLLALEEAKKYDPPWSGRLAPPRKPPPLHVWADVYCTKSIDDMLRKVYRALSAGVDAIVLGGLPGCDASLYRRVLGQVSRDIPVLADPAGLASPEEAYSHGADGYMSLTPHLLGSVPSYLRGEMVFVIVPDVLGPPSVRVASLVSAGLRAVDLGFKRIVLDPVLQPTTSPGALNGLFAARILSERVGWPLMLGVNNVYEMLDADTTGSIALLTALAAEAGVSVILASEESPKSRGAFLEARIAADLASLSLFLGTPAKDYPVRVFGFKEKRLH